jgi:hypothetical protein
MVRRSAAAETTFTTLIASGIDIQAESSVSVVGNRGKCLQEWGLQVSFFYSRLVKRNEIRKRGFYS